MDIRCSLSRQHDYFTCTLLVLTPSADTAFTMYMPRGSPCRASATDEPLFSATLLPARLYTVRRAFSVVPTVFIAVVSRPYVTSSM